MDRYMRAYRDVKSPLTPLTPLGAMSAFTFNINDVTPKHTTTPTNTPSSCAAGNRNGAAARFSTDFQRLRSIFEPRQPCKCAAKKKQRERQQHLQQQQHTQADSEDDENTDAHADGTQITANNHSNNNLFLKIPDHINAKKCTRTPTTPAKNSRACQYRKASPIAVKPLSPRISALLEQAGVDNLKGLFQREEIDTAVLRLMKPQDLEHLGIQDKDDIRRIRGLISGAWNFLCSTQK